MPEKASDVSGQIRNFIEKAFPLAASTPFEDGDSLLEAGIIDSMGILEVVTFLEKDLGITVSDDDLTPENFSSVRSLSDFVSRRLT